MAYATSNAGRSRPAPKQKLPRRRHNRARMRALPFPTNIRWRKGGSCNTPLHEYERVFERK